METIIKTIETEGMKLLGGIIVIVVGIFLIRRILKSLTQNERFNSIESTLRGFLLNCVRVLLFVLLILTAASIMGIPLTSFVTILASAGVAVSLAIQGALTNFVGGLTIILLKPFKVGDHVRISDTEGKVQSIGLFYTEFITSDNRHISLPNSNLTNTAISNFTREGTRRVDVSFNIRYTAEIDEVKAVLTSVIANTADILPDPAPTVKLSECRKSSMTFLMRVWCNSDACENVRWNLLENGKKALTSAGI